MCTCTGAPTSKGPPPKIKKKILKSREKENKDMIINR
jgi:hypothetical protein